MLSGGSVSRTGCFTPQNKAISVMSVLDTLH